MKPYLDLLRDVYENGKQKENRTGTGTKYLFGTNLRIDLQKGFPLLTTKKVLFKAAVAEMVGFFKGATTVKEFRDLGCPVWDEWGLSRSVFNIVNRDQAEIAADLAVTLNCTVEEALAKIQEAADISTQYHETINELASAGDAAKLTEYMEKNPTPPSLDAFLQKHGASPKKRNYLGKEGDLGPIYGKQWIRWETTDGREINQLKQVVHQLRTNPTDRRIILTAWNPGDISDNSSKEMPDGIAITNAKERCDANVLEGKMALPPCHLLVIFDVDTSGDRPQLNCHLTMRSNDLPLGCPFNIAGYAMLTHALAKLANMDAGTLVIACANSHIYMNQLEGVEEQLSRKPGKLPTFEFPDDVDITDADSLSIETVEKIVAGLKDYEHQSFIKFPISV